MLVPGRDSDNHVTTAPRLQTFPSEFVLPTGSWARAPGTVAFDPMRCAPPVSPSLVCLVLSLLVSLVFSLVHAPRVAGQDAGPDGGTAGDASVPLVARAPRPAAAVATAGNDVLVTAEDVAASIDARPAAMRGQYADPARIDDAGDELVRDRLLADEARARGVDGDSEVRREIDRVLARVLAERLTHATPETTPTAAQIQAFYDAHQADYTRPEQAHVLGIPLETRAEAEQVARAVRGTSESHFRSLARRHIHSRRLRSSGGDLGFVFAGGAADPAIVEAALALSNVGDTSDPAETDERFWILFLLEKRPPEPIPLADLQRSIASRMARERERAAVAELAARLALQRHVQMTPASRVVQMRPE